VDTEKERLVLDCKIKIDEELSTEFANRKFVCKKEWTIK
jgi:hypothetical protein